MFYFVKTCQWLDLCVFIFCILVVLVDMEHAVLLFSHSGNHFTNTFSKILTSVSFPAVTDGFTLCLPVCLCTASEMAISDQALNILCVLMKDQWSCLCTENIQRTIRLLFGTLIERCVFTPMIGSDCGVINLL